MVCIRWCYPEYKGAIKISQEKIFEEAIKSSFKIINKHRDGSLEPHFIVAGEYYSNFNHGNIDRLKQFIRDQMKLYQMKSVMVTAVYLKKDSLITQEKMESYSNGENKYRRISMNDNLETLFEELQQAKYPSFGVETYYLPKLTKHQRALVDSKDVFFCSTFYDKKSLDVAKKRTKLPVSDSNELFILGECHRRTFRIRIQGQKFSTEKSGKCVVQ